MSSTSQPPSSAPRMAASDRSGDDSRMSWPTTMRLGAKWSTYARAIRYAPSASSSSGITPRTSYALKTFGSSVTGSRLHGAPGVPQQLPGVVQVLRHHAHVGQHGHEVDVAVPARHHVQVEMPLDARAGRPAEVEAGVRAVRAQRPVEHAERLVEQLPQLRPLLGV